MEETGMRVLVSFYYKKADKIFEDFTE